MSEFLQSAAGRAVAGAVIAVLFILIIDLNYKWFFKLVLDFIFAFLAVIITSPVLIAGAVISRKNAERVYEKTPVLGKGGKIIYITSYAGIERGIKNLPRLLDVLCGRLSFVGIKPMSIGDGALLDDSAMERFAARPGIFSNLALSGDDELTYEQAFKLDKAYAKRRELFTDIFIIIKCAVLAMRGERKSYLGETRDKTYAEVLIERGTITAEEAERAFNAALEAEEEGKKRKDVKNNKYN
ncbi:MAG: sugar transferase [Clostridia bacterium]|nr:sugar transferase [Clostridia bacterium]